MENIVNIVQNMDGEELMDIIDEVFDEEEIIDESDHALSDSDYKSDQSGVLLDVIRRTVPTSEILTLNGQTKHCAISFYYSTGGALNLCASCMILLADAGVGSMIAVRKHEIKQHDAIGERFCSNCRNACFIILPCNVCPVCINS